MRHYKSEHSSDSDTFNVHERLLKAKELCNKISNRQQFLIQGGNLKHGTTEYSDLFDEVVKAVDIMELVWYGLCSVTTDGAPSMSGVKNGMAELIGNSN